MSYFADLEPFVIRAHNQELINEVSKLRPRSASPIAVRPRFRIHLREAEAAAALSETRHVACRTRCLRERAPNGPLR
jgi:hypothetical protein